MIDLHEILLGKWEDGTRPKDLYANHIAKEPKKYLDSIIKGLGSDQKRIQSGCAELGSFLSEDRPELLYPYIDLFMNNLEAKEPVLRWEAVCTIGNLAEVDGAGKVLNQLNSIIAFLDDKSIVLQGHAVRALTKIVKKHPERGKQVLDALVSARAKFPGNRVGFLVEAMGFFALLPKDRSRALEFAKEYIDSDIKSVATKAKKAVRELQKS
ncbi:MAG: hypothetical protein ACFFDR_11955 [Candidatus Thorarchaeota archaeon]